MIKDICFLFFSPSYLNFQMQIPVNLKIKKKNSGLIRTRMFHNEDSINTTVRVKMETCSSVMLF